MIAHRASHRLPDAASRIPGESTLAPDARLREIARLLAVGALRAMWGHTAAHVGNGRVPQTRAGWGLLSNRLALGPAAERACGRARAPGVARARLADASTESER